MNNNEDSCFAKILKVIYILQKNASGGECFDGSCTRPFLGGTPDIVCFNTRPISFYLSDGSLFEATYQSISSTQPLTSSIFRIEKVMDNCVLLRILEASSSPTAISPYQATNQFITVNLNCICALRCLSDVVLENI